VSEPAAASLPSPALSPGGPVPPPDLPSPPASPPVTPTTAEMDSTLRDFQRGEQL
jgi:hypothetical protein